MPDTLMADTLDIKTKLPFPAGALRNPGPHASELDDVACASMERRAAPASGGRWQRGTWRLTASNALRDHQLVVVAPLPVLARLERPHDRVLGRAEVLARVAFGRGIAAADVSARKAETQVHPLRADGEAFLAALSARRHLVDRLQMAALSNHSKLPSEPSARAAMS